MIHLYKMNGTKEKIEKRKKKATKIEHKKLIEDYLFDD